MYFFHNFFFKKLFCFAKSSFQIIIKLLKTQLVAVFEHAVVRRIPLYSIISQMNVFVIKRVGVGVVFWAACADVAFVEEEAVHIMIDKNPNSDIKFSAFY